MTKSTFSKALNPLKTISDDSIWHPKGHPSILGKSENLQFFGSGPGLMSMDSICMLLRHGICCMDMVYALGRWDMLYGHGKCLVVGEEYLCCIYSTCFVGGMYFQRRFLRKNDFE